MTDRRPLSRSEMRRIVVMEFDATLAVSKRVPKLADLLTRVAKSLPQDATPAEWAAMLDITGSLNRLAGEAPDKDLVALAKLAYEDPEAAVSIIGDLLLIQTGLLAAEAAIITFLGPAP